MAQCTENGADRLECPMCDFTVSSPDDYFLQLHFEQVHTTDSPFRIDDDPETQLPLSQYDHEQGTPSSDEEEATVACPEPDCGEVVLLIEFNDHLDYHAAESLSFDETTGKYYSRPSKASTQQHPLMAHSAESSLQQSSKSLHGDTHSSSGRRRKTKRHKRRHRSNTDSSEKSTLSRSVVGSSPFSTSSKAPKPPSKSARLGKSELGPYAWEERMPKWLHDQLAAGPVISVVNRIGRDGRLIKEEKVQNETPGIIPVLAQLSALDNMVKEAYYCHPSTLHIGKTPREGGFCGYRNIQMLLSYIQGAKAQGHEEFPGRTPGILKLQDIIEDAWDKNINSIGRVQTGGIRGTRKYIGTPEAQAFFLNTEIDCAVEMFSDCKARKAEAHEALIAAAERYFAQGASLDGSNVHKTLLPPIYLQQPGHSITIIGFERRQDGSCNLVVFDPMYSTSPAMHKLLGRKNIRNARPEVLHAYRRGSRQLRKHAAFEILMLTATPPQFPAWDVLRQFPDCRFVYAFFRSRTLGYDVYPEDYFLQNFPWQQYGGLWMCDDARFARAGPIDPRKALILRRVTGEDIDSPANSASVPIGSIISTNNHEQHTVGRYERADTKPRGKSLASSMADVVNTPLHRPVDRNCSSSGSTAITSASKCDIDALRKHLERLETDDRCSDSRSSPTSPNFLLKGIFHSMDTIMVNQNITHSSAGTIQKSLPSLSYHSPKQSSALSLSQLQNDGRCATCMQSIDSAFIQSKPPCCTIISSTEVSQSGTPMRSWSNSTCSTSTFEVSSPRVAMAKNVIGRRKPADLSHIPSLVQNLGLELHPQTVIPSSAGTSTPSSPLHTSTFPSIDIANGTEASLSSPISPFGTILAYKSQRSPTSGLLSVRPLSEAEVAEYRFWRPCSRRDCAIGCGRAHHGEWAAAKRLFATAEDVKLDLGCAEEKVDPKSVSQRAAAVKGADINNCGKSTESIWAGRRLVTDWKQFVQYCERDGVARF